MPTPDTEALAARLRAVERALTGDETTLDPPHDGGEAPTASPDAEPPPDVADRLSRLEAAVQALRAALDERGRRTDPTNPSERADPGLRDGAVMDRTNETATGGTAADGEHAGRDRQRVRKRSSAGRWPDDLGPE